MGFLGYVEYTLAKGRSRVDKGVSSRVHIYTAHTVLMSWCGGRFGGGGEREGAEDSIITTDIRVEGRKSLFGST